MTDKKSGNRGDELAKDHKRGSYNDSQKRSENTVSFDKPPPEKPKKE
jgi:hypothetical protein